MRAKLMGLNLGVRRTCSMTENAAILNWSALNSSSVYGAPGGRWGVVTIRRTRPKTSLALDSSVVSHAINPLHLSPSMRRGRMGIPELLAVGGLGYVELVAGGSRTTSPSS